MMDINTLALYIVFLYRNKDLVKDFFFPTDEQSYLKEAQYVRQRFFLKEVFDQVKGSMNLNSEMTPWEFFTLIKDPVEKANSAWVDAWYRIPGKPYPWRDYPFDVSLFPAQDVTLSEDDIATQEAACVDTKGHRLRKMLAALPHTLQVANGKPVPNKDNQKIWAHRKAKDGLDDDDDEYEDEGAL